MFISHQFHDQICVIEVQGNITLDQVQAFRDYVHRFIEEESTKNFLVNMTDVDFIDSSGIGVMIFLWKIAHRREGILALSNLNNRLTRLINMTSLTELIKIYETLEEALRDPNFSTPLKEFSR
ncbi:STAS domain-containing protein [Deltaproteobacteria bacterium TL4]